MAHRALIDGLVTHHDTTLTTGWLTVPIILAQLAKNVTARSGNLFSAGRFRNLPTGGYA